LPVLRGFEREGEAATAQKWRCEVIRWLRDWQLSGQKRLYGPVAKSGHSMALSTAVLPVVPKEADLPRTSLTGHLRSLEQRPEIHQNRTLAISGAHFSQARGALARRARCDPALLAESLTARVRTRAPQPTAFGFILPA
jgi:hypothetical protein